MISKEKIEQATKEMFAMASPQLSELANAGRVRRLNNLVFLIY